MSLHTNYLYWHPLTHIQSHSLAVNRLLSTKGVRMLHGHCVEYSFSRLRWMQKSPVHSEAATAARKTAENQPALQWLSELRTDVLHLPPFLLLSHQHARSLSLSFSLALPSVAGVCYLPTSLRKHPPFFPSLLHYRSSCMQLLFARLKTFANEEKERERYTGRAKEGGRGRKRQLSACGLLEAILHSTWYAKCSWWQAAWIQTIVKLH